MKKNLLVMCGLMMIGVMASAQVSETQSNAASLDKGQLVFKPMYPAEDKTDVYTITATGAASFSISNTADGTWSSYKHALKITIGLTSPDLKSGNIELVFYPEGEKQQYAAASVNNTISVYYPVEIFDEIKTKLDQSLAARKKVQLKVTINKNNFREGILMF